MTNKKVKKESLNPHNITEGTKNSLDQSGLYVWKIKNFTRLTQQEEYSEEFQVGNYRWVAQIQPRGNTYERQPNQIYNILTKGNVGAHTWISIYLNLQGSNNFLQSWFVQASFKITLINQVDESKNQSQVKSHIFQKGDYYEGLTQFCLLEQVINQQNGFIINDNVIFMVEIIILSQNNQINMLQPVQNINDSKDLNIDMERKMEYMEKQIGNVNKPLISKIELLEKKIKDIQGLKDKNTDLESRMVYLGNQIGDVQLPLISIIQNLQEVQVQHTQRNNTIPMVLIIFHILLIVTWFYKT